MRDVVAPPPSPRPLTPWRLRRWILAGFLGLLLGGLIVVATQVNWFEDPPVSKRVLGPGQMSTRDAKGKITVVEMGIPSLGGPGLPAGIPPETFLDRSRAPEVGLTGQKIEKSKGFDYVGKVPANLAVTLDPKTGWLLVAAPDGRFHGVELPGCKPVVSCQLDRPAYHLAVDANRRLLYTAAASAASIDLGLLGDRERAVGDLHVYDLDSLLKGTATEAKPIRTLDLDAHLTGLTLSPTGNELFFTSEAYHDVQICRLDTRAWKRDKYLWLRVSGPTGLSLASDRPELHALAGGRLLVLDARTWKVLDSVAVGNSITAVLAGKDRRVYLLERRYQSQVQIVDLPRREVLGMWNLEHDGRPYVRLAADGTRLVVGTSAVTAGKIWAMDVSGKQFHDPVFTGHARSDRTRLLRGGMHVIDGSPYVVSGTGYVFRGGT